MIEIVVTNEQGRESEPDSVTITVNPANTPSNPLPLLFERILGFGDNTNIQAQENRENNLDGPFGNDQMYSDSDSSTSVHRAG
jgi:hypothetical protein